MTDGFDARRARSKRPCPMWVDAFLRDTQDLEADQIGAYHLILYAMWGRVTCDFPMDERKLARVSRCSLHRWRRVIGPALLPFFQHDGGVLKSKKLKECAAYVENLCTRQHENRSQKKIAEKTCNTLKTHDQGLTMDDTMDSTMVGTMEPTMVDPVQDSNIGESSTLLVGNASDEKQPVRKHRGVRIPEDWTPSEDDREFARSKGFTDAQIDNHATEFFNYWSALSGQRAVKSSDGGWSKTWQNRILTLAAKTPEPNPGSGNGRSDPSQAMLAGFATSVLPPGDPGPDESDFR